MSDCEVCSGETRPWSLAPEDTLRRCPACGHVTRDLRDCPAGARDAAWGGDEQLDRFRLAVTYRRLRRLAPAAVDVCEVGFGSGSLLRRFVDDGARATGIELDMLGVGVDPTVARKARLVSGEIESLDLPSGSFDLIYAIHVIEHMRDPLAFLHACHGLLRPGGRLALLTPAGDSAGLELFGSAWWLLEDPTHVRFLSRRSAAISVRRAGFDDIRTRRLLADNLSMEATSAVRRFRPRQRPHGVLSTPAVVGLAALSAPAVVVARVLVPRLRPTLEVTAVKGAGP